MPCTFEWVVIWTKIWLKSLKGWGRGIIFRFLDSCARQLVQLLNTSLLSRFFNSTQTALTCWHESKSFGKREITWPVLKDLAQKETTIVKETKNMSTAIMYQIALHNIFPSFQALLHHFPSFLRKSAWNLLTQLICCTRISRSKLDLDDLGKKPTILLAIKKIKTDWDLEIS